MRYVSLCLILWAAPLAAQRQKDPGTASLWAVFVPGAGHLYAGETKKGIALLVAGATAFGVTVAQWDRQHFETHTYPNPPGMDPPTYTETVREDYKTPAYVAAGAYAAIWLYSLVDAGPAAKRHNTSLAIVPGPRGLSVAVTIMHH